MTTNNKSSANNNNNQKLTDEDGSASASSSGEDSSDSDDSSVELSVSDGPDSAAQRTCKEIEDLKRERVDLLRQVKQLLEQLEQGEQEKLDMLAFCRESNEKSAACLREVVKLKNELDHQKRRVRAALAERQTAAVVGVDAATQTATISNAASTSGMVEYDSADRSLQQCLHILGGSVASAADSGRGDTNSAHSAQSEDSPDRQRRDADEFYDDVTADDEVVTAVTTAAPAQSQPPQQRQTGEDVEFGRQKLLRTSTRTKKSSGGGAAGRQDQLAREALSLPLSRWRAEHVAAWAASPTVGLAIYAERLQATVKSGDILARLTDSDMQRELAIQEPLHRRRLRLAIDRLTSPDSRAPQPAPSLDCVWLASQLLPSLGLRQLADQFRCAMVDCSLLLTLDKADLKGSQLAVRQRRYRRSLALGVALLRYVRLDWDKLVAIRQKFASNLLLYWSANCLHSWLLLWGAPVSEDRVLESGLHGAYLVWSGGDWEKPMNDLLKGAHCRKAVLMELNRLVKESLAQCDRPPQPASAASAADAASSTGGSTVSSTADLSAAPSTNNGSSQQQPKQKQQQVKQRSPSPPPPPPTQQQKKPIKPVPPVPASRASLLGGGAGGGEFRRAFRRELSSVSSAEHQQQQQKQQQQPPQAHARLSLRGGGVGISTAMPPPIAAVSKLPFKNTMI